MSSSCIALADYIEGYASTRGTSMLAGSTALTNAEEMCCVDLVANNYPRMINTQSGGGLVSDMVQASGGVGPRYRSRPAMAGTYGRSTSPVEMLGVYGASEDGALPRSTFALPPLAAAGTAAAKDEGVSTPPTLQEEGSFTQETPQIKGLVPRDELDDGATPEVTSTYHSDYTAAWREFFAARSTQRATAHASGHASGRGRSKRAAASDDGCSVMAGCARVTRTMADLDVWGTRQRALEELELAQDVWEASNDERAAGERRPATMTSVCADDVEHGLWWHQPVQKTWVRNSLAAMSLKAFVADSPGACCTVSEAGERIRNRTLNRVNRAYHKPEPKNPAVVLAHPLARENVAQLWKMCRSKFFDDLPRREVTHRLEVVTSRAQQFELFSAALALYHVVDTCPDINTLKRTSPITKLKRDLLLALPEENWKYLMHMPFSYPLGAYKKPKVACSTAAVAASGQPAPR